MDASVPFLKGRGPVHTDRLTAQGVPAQAWLLVRRGGRKLAPSHPEGNMLAHALARQARHPSGLLGRLFARGMGRINGGVNDWVIEQLEVRDDHRVLEIGFGPGTAVRRVERLLASGRVCGIDASRTMVDQAARLNRAAIAAGKVDLRQGEAALLPYQDRSFDRIFCVNVIYFWRAPEREIGEMFRVAREGARVAIYIGDREQMLRVPMTRTGVFRLFSPDEVMQLLQGAGFVEQESHHASIRQGPISKGSCITATRPRG
jgi:SAM-dependent methyltransferase